jgi:hypothetical protein
MTVSTRGIEIYLLPTSCLTLADYCLEIRKHIKLGKPLTEKEQRYIDTVEFWKEQYSQLYLEKKQLETRLVRLDLLAKQDDGVHETSPSYSEGIGSLYRGMSSSILAPSVEEQLQNCSASGQPATLIKGAPNSKRTDTRMTTKANYCSPLSSQTVRNAASTFTRR